MQSNLVESLLSLKLVRSVEGARKIISYVFGSNKVLDFDEFYSMFQTQPAMDRVAKLVT
jgi:hypothetical protein